MPELLLQIFSHLEYLKHLPSFVYWYIEVGLLLRPLIKCRVELCLKMLCSFDVTCLMLDPQQPPSMEVAGGVLPLSRDLLVTCPGPMSRSLASCRSLQHAQETWTWGTLISPHSSESWTTLARFSLKMTYSTESKNSFETYWRRIQLKKSWTSSSVSKAAVTWSSLKKSLVKSQVLMEEFRLDNLRELVLRFVSLRFHPIVSQHLW